MSVAPVAVAGVRTRAWTGWIRAVLISGGVLAVLMVLAAAVAARRDGRVPGPAQLQVGAAGLLFIVAGLLRGPSRAITTLRCNHALNFAVLMLVVLRGRFPF